MSKAPPPPETARFHKAKRPPATGPQRSGGNSGEEVMQ